MKKYIIGAIITVLIAAGFVLLAREGSESTEDSEVNIVASIFPLYDLAREVAGEDAEVKILVPPGASPHTLDITPEIARIMEEADIIFTIGHGLDDFLFRNRKKLAVVDKGITIRAGEEEHGPTDPHYWLSPRNANRITETIAEELGKIDPENAEKYEARAENYRLLLTEKEEEWKEKLNVEGIKIVTFHDAFAYFADFFGINIVETVEASPGREPTAKELAYLRKLVADNGIATLFVEPQLSGDVISQFAKDTGVRLDILDPLGGVEGRESYVELIEYNLQRIKTSI